MKVVLHTFPPVQHAYSISPFAIKLESYLRLNGIPYEVVHTSKFGPKLKIPYIHFYRNAENDEFEVIPDSNIIISRLEQIIGESKDSKLTAEEKAVAHAILRMIEEHTSQIGFYFRYSKAMTEFLQVLDIGNHMFSADTSQKGKMISAMFGKLMPTGFAKKMKARGLSCHEDEELWKFSNDDLLAISTYLGEKKYFLGKDHATSIDCAIFGHLSQFLYIPLGFPQREFMKKHCQNIVQFMERFKNEFWPDWEAKCTRKENQNLIESTKQTRLVNRNIRNILVPSLLVGIIANVYFHPRVVKK